MASYRNLDTYKDAKQLVKDVYALLMMFPREEQYALCDQLRRAVISVPSNIAEGMGRTSVKDQAHFLEISFGSLQEVQCQLEIASELGYISIDQFKEIDTNIEKLSRKLSGLRAKRVSSPLTLHPSPITQ